MVALAATLLSWRLDAIYLWQDEANTAVLAKRLLQFGKPLAYDGVNLLTSDHFAVEDATTIDARTKDPRAAVDYVIRRGDLRADGAWIYQPWGQFVVAAAGIEALGATTLGARWLFALAALATVVALYLLARNVMATPGAALLAAALLVANAAWILHGRQARYYALSSLFLVLTLAAYERWQRGARHGSTLFVATAWLYFQVDYGTVWPVLAVLFTAALVARPEARRDTLATGITLAATLLPFVFFYQLWGRRSAQIDSWFARLGGNAFNINRHVVPCIVVAAAAALLLTRWKRLEIPQRRFAAVAIGILAALLVWVPTVAPGAFLRYAIVAAPIGALLTAWLLVNLVRSKALMWAGAAIVAVTPWVALSFDAALRPELRAMASEVFTRRKDANGMVIEWLRANARPTDEILINYEDIPLMYYLPNPVRGGIAAFRVEDDAKGPPEFLVLRRSVRFVHWPVFEREVNRYKWERVPLGAPDVPWGNLPDPLGRIDTDRADDLIIARRRGG